MSIELILFYGFASVLVASALAVVIVRNSVHAALSLVLAFFTSACIWLLAKAEFLAIALVLVYVGAVMVLFLFVVMMLDIKPDVGRERFTRYLPVGLLVASVMLAEMLALMGWNRFAKVTLPIQDGATQAGMSNTEWIGHELFTRYVLPFEVAAVILTVAIIAAITLTLRKRSGTKTQDPAKQVMVRKQDRIRVLKVAPEKAEEHH